MNESIDNGEKCISKMIEAHSTYIYLNVKGGVSMWYSISDKCTKILSENLSIASRHQPIVANRYMQMVYIFGTINAWNHAYKLSSNKERWCCTVITYWSEFIHQVLIMCFMVQYLKGISRHCQIGEHPSGHEDATYVVLSPNWEKEGWIDHTFTSYTLSLFCRNILEEARMV